VGATVTVNGVRRGVTPLLVQGLDPGLVSLEVAKNGKFATSQVAITQKSYQRVNLTLEKVSGDLLLTALRTKTSALAQPVAVDDVASFVRDMELIIDGTTVAQVKDVLLPNLEPGTHDVQLLGKGWCWQETFVIKQREAVQIQPVFTPVGTLKFDVPTDAMVSLVDTDGVILNVEGGTDTIRDFPAGKYQVTVGGRRYQDRLVPLVLDQGGSATLKLVPDLKPSFDRGLQVKALQSRISSAGLALPGQNQSRQGFDTLGAVGTGTGVAALLAGGVMGLLAYLTYVDYTTATFSSDIIKKRELATTLFQIAVPVGIAGAGTALGSALVGFGLGERPDQTQTQIKRWQDQVSELMAAGVEY
jgi:hypothetical protein